MQFISPSKGRMTLEQVYQDIVAFMQGAPDANFKVIIGTDSQVKEETCFVTAIIIHHVGRGARYYYRKKRQRKITSLRQKIFYETALSLETASQLAGKLAAGGHEELNVEIHLDIGCKGETKELIREIVGMVVGSGFDAKIKPDSCGASKVADKYTK
ncbi:MAG: ribonuclease H-like YkuK family protein [Bacillota bacterium]